MIRFFRNIRQKLFSENRFSKYLLYAIGEIVLVVIGILIALQINTWNDNRIKNNQVKSYAIKLISDLAQDIQEVKRIIGQAKVAYIRYDSLANYIRNLDINDYKNLDIFVLTYNARYRPYSWNRSTYEALKSTGILSYFDNDSLINLLVKYDASSKHMDADYLEDIELLREASNLMHKTVNSNYKLENRLPFNFLTPGYLVFNQVEITDYKNADFYLRLEKQSIDFIDRDKRKLDEMINAFIDLKFNFRTRYNLELPSLIQNAKIIINLLETSYLMDDIKKGKIKRYQSKELLELVQEGKTIEEIINIIKSDDINDQIYDTSRDGIHKFGYNLMELNKDEEALKIFKLNTELNYHWNSMDSYGEILLKLGDTLNALKAYTTSLELNPNNLNAKRILERLK